MTKVLRAVPVFLVVALAVASPLRESTGDVGGTRILAQHGRCSDDQYLESNKCCLNCEAGKRMTSPCIKDGEMGSCEECDSGTYMEHSNNLRRCLTCTKCRSDQQMAQACISTQDTVCQCSPGRFCIPDQACEVCKKCRRCKAGEKVFKNCTTSSDTECYESHLAPFPVWVILIILIGTVVITVITVLVYKKWRHRLPYCQSRLRDNSEVDDMSQGTLEGRQNAQNGSVAVPLLPTEATRPKVSVNDDDADLGLGESSSENSLSVPCQSCVRVRTTLDLSMLNKDDDPQLVPLKGEQSLKKCFEYFEELDVKFLMRFFRSLDLSDNAITDAMKRLDTPDAVHELLTTWLQKEGSEASLNHLLTKLRYLNQNLTADKIMEKALSNGHYEPKVEKRVDSTSNSLVQE